MLYHALTTVILLTLATPVYAQLAVTRIAVESGGGSVQTPTLFVTTTIGQSVTGGSCSSPTSAYVGFWTTTPDSPRCRADFNCDQIVNAADVGAFLTAYFSDLSNGTTHADIDGNGVVTAADVGAYLTLYFAQLGPCD